CVCISPSGRSNMAVAQVNLEDFSVYSLLSDEELLHIVVERSLCDRHRPHDWAHTSSLLSPSSSSSSSAPPPAAAATQNNFKRGESSSRKKLCVFCLRELSPVTSMILNGDTDTLMDLVRRGSDSLMKPNNEGWIALHEAAYYGKQQLVSILIRAFPESVNRRSAKNQTALLLAAGRGNVSCVDFLLNHGANPNIANTDQETPLFIACESPNRDVVHLLLRSGAQVNRCSVQGVSALQEACRHGQLELCTMLLDAGADLETNNIYGITPFFTAAQHGEIHIMHLLYERGADINDSAGDGATPLFEACKNGHVSAVKMLLALKADANQSVKSGLLPLHVAVQNNHKQIVMMLIPVTSRVRIQLCGISPLHVAAEKNWDDIMELLIQSGFDVNAKLSAQHSMMYEDRRTTALYFSVYNGNLEASEMLLEAGADPNLDVFNPLLIAVRLGWLDMATLLLKYGADVNAQISTQPSSFPSAILLNMESLPVLKLLLVNGCDARPCFICPHGQNTHPAVTQPDEETQPGGDLLPLRCVQNLSSILFQFCEAVSSPSFCRVTGPIISTLLDHVGHVQLCARLLEVLENCSDLAQIKLKAAPPRPLMQYCRLKIRRLLGVHRLRLLHTLPLPAQLIRFLCHNLTGSLT
uniref:Ankyrin repeat and SOCS box protein 2-like n=1 Tax=Labrus bergylta TaxID=56723 RepID=A0A3Q3NC15_9LABR